MFINDAFYQTDILFAQVTPIHAITGLLGILMSSMALLGFIIKPQKRILFYMSWPTLIIAMCYGLSIFILYQAG
ncbi:MAG: hypothetical protein R3A45_03240 [Bdellovibrionota bacterium]